MAEAPDDIELQDFEEQKEEEKGEEETNVDEDDDFVTGILGLDTSSPPSVPYNPEVDNADHVKLGLEQKEALREGQIRNAKQQIVRQVLEKMNRDGFVLNERNGSANGELLDRLDLRYGRGNRITGLTFETATGKKSDLVVSEKRRGSFKVSTRIPNDDFNEFTRLLDSAYEEFRQTPTGKLFGKIGEKVGNIRNKATCVLTARFKTAEEINDSLQWNDEDLGIYDNQSVSLEDVDSEAELAVSTFEKEESEDRGLEEAKRKDVLSATEEREIRNLLTVEQMRHMTREEVKASLNAQKNHWTLKKIDAVEDAKENRKKQFEKELRRINEQEEVGRLLFGEEPQTKRAQQLSEENLVDNDVTRLERFKKFVRENALILSGVTIMFGTLITSIVMAARQAVRQTATATQKLAKAVINIGKKIAPLLAPVFSLIGTALSLGAKGVSWLAKNLWVLAILLAYLFYDQGKEQMRKRRKK